MAKQNTPAPEVSAATKQQEPEMREIIRDIKRATKGYQVLVKLGMKKQADELKIAIGGLREKAIKRFTIELDNACAIDAED